MVGPIKHGKSICHPLQRMKGGLALKMEGVSPIPADSRAYFCYRIAMPKFWDKPNAWMKLPKHWFPANQIRKKKRMVFTVVRLGFGTYLTSTLKTTSQNHEYYQPSWAYVVSLLKHLLARTHLYPHKKYVWIVLASFPRVLVGYCTEHLLLACLAMISLLCIS